MAKVYMVRHQRAGIITSHVFSSPPTAEQQAPVLAECARVHGPDGWAIVHEAELLGAGELPAFPSRAEERSDIPGPTVQAVGTVTARETMTVGAEDVGSIDAILKT